MTRTAQIERKTAETEIQLSLALDGAGAGERATGTSTWSSGPAAISTPARTTRSRTLGSASARRWTRRSATGPG